MMKYSIGDVISTSLPKNDCLYNLIGLIISESSYYDQHWFDVFISGEIYQLDKRWLKIHE